MWIYGGVSRQKEQQIALGWECAWYVGGIARSQSVEWDEQGRRGGSPSGRGDGWSNDICRSLAFTVNDMGNHWRVFSRRVVQSDLTV